MNTHGQRKTGIELLRILAMLMVVGIHYLNFGGLLWSDAVWNRRLGWLLILWLPYWGYLSPASLSTHCGRSWQGGCCGLGGG